MTGRNCTIYALLLTAGGLLVSLSACVNDPAEVLAFEEKLNENVETAEDVRIVFSDSGMVRGIVTAPLMLNFLDKSDPRQEFPDGLNVEFLDENQLTTSTLVANWGVYRKRKRTITVRDSVVWESTDLQKLETEELNWNEKEEKIHTNKFVVLSQPDYLITGYGLEADQSFENARVLRVDGRIPVKRE